MAEFTHKEIKEIIAPLLKCGVEDIDDFVIIARGKCETCAKRDGLTTLDSADSLVDFIELMNGGLDCRIATVI